MQFRLRWSSPALQKDGLDRTLFRVWSVLLGYYILNLQARVATDEL